MTAAERIYRAALVAYSRAYRRERGDEIVGTLLERDSRVRPGELVSLVFEGVAQRGRIAHAGNDAAAVRAGLRLGGFAVLWLIAVVQATDIGVLARGEHFPAIAVLTSAAAILSLLAVVRGRWALPLIFQLGSLIVVVAVLGQVGRLWSMARGVSFDDSTIAVFLVWIAPALFVFLGRPRVGEPEDRRSWWWVPGAVALGGFIGWHDLFFTSWLGRPLVVVLVAWILVGRRDLRLAVGGAVAAAVPAAAVLVARYSVVWISPQEWVAYAFTGLAATSALVSLVAVRESRNSSRQTQ